MAQDLRGVNGIESLMTYFSEKLGWAIDMDDYYDVDDITYDFEAADLGLKEEAFAKITSLKQLRPLVDNQRWGIFFVNFESSRFEVSALRKILSGLIPSRRNADHAVWDKKDLLFLCIWGERNRLTIGAAHFKDSEKGLPQIKMISCEPAVEDFTQINVFEQRLAKLAWPNNPSDAEAWQEAWASAFTTRYRQTIRDAHTLTARLAVEAQNIRDRILNTLEIETSNGYVHLLFQKFRDTLVHDMTEQQFADMYAQTVVYGLFSARCMDDSQEDFNAAEAVECIPNTNPFLKGLLQECLGSNTSESKLSFDELEVGNIVDLLLHTQTDSIIRDFNRQTGGGREDPVIHFYEEFLSEYDKFQRVQRGVYYTPQPVVNFIVRSVDDILKSKFGISDGLASTKTKQIKIKRKSKRKQNGFYREVEDTEEVPAIQILDPATGTGTFLRQMILQIYQNFCDARKGMAKEQIRQEWNAYVPEHLLPRVNGFELMMAPYAVAHMKLAMVLKDTGYDFHSNERLKLYLTNALEEPGTDTNQLSFDNDPLAFESVEANGVKENSGINIIVGNPPYSGESANKGFWISQLMDSYKQEPGTSQKLKEANSKFINDDYIKFMRYAQFIIDRTGSGILCFINPHGYIDNPTFRGVRWRLMQSFNEVYILDLHGNSKKKEKTPDGSKDENVFDIQQGVCINIFIKRQGSRQKTVVHHADLYGTRDAKYTSLQTARLEDIAWSNIPLVGPNYLFNYHASSKEDEYNEGISLRELFPLGTLGILSKRDSLVVAFHEDELKKKITTFADLQITTEEVCSLYKIPVRDNDKWSARAVREKVHNLKDWESFITDVHYRPFDIRPIFYFSDIIARPNTKVLKHLQRKDNAALILCRQGGASNLENWDCAFAVNSICDQNIYRRGGGTVLPLYCYSEEIGTTVKKPNLDPQILSQIEESINLKMKVQGANNDPSAFSPEDLLGYIYAILYSRKYRTKFQEYLNKDFPKIPIPTDSQSFRIIAELGTRLLNCHLYFTKVSHDEDLKFVGDGINVVEKATFKGNALYINKNQYFTPVTEDVFSFTIGGNSPLQKWIKDRKGVVINSTDVEIFMKTITTIRSTLRIMDEIDRSIFF